MTCVRQAWLVLGTQQILLHDVAHGVFCTSLDLGSPDVREVVNNRPDRDGVTDRTKYLGGRVVSADISTLTDAGAQIDAIAAAFAPYMVPSARPVLHYVLDRPGAAERTMTLRAKAYAWPIDNDWQRDIQLQWLAADPTAYDPTVRTATSRAGMAGGGGRIYPLTFPRTYPTGSAPPSIGTVRTNGDLPARPVFVIWGPAQAPAFTLTAAGQPTPAFTFAFRSGVNLSAGDSVTIDADAHTVTYGTGVSGLADVDWTQTVWPLITPATDYTLRLNAPGGNQVTQVIATWQDGYLS
jgi:hypothetical protein